MMNAFGRRRYFDSQMSFPSPVGFGGRGNGDRTQLFRQDQVLEFCAVRFLLRRQRSVWRVGIEEPSALQRKVDRFAATMDEIRVDDFGHVVHVDVHVDQLLQVEIHVSRRVTKDAIADVRLNSRLFRVEEVHDGVRHVKQFRLEPAQQQRLFPSCSAFADGSHDCGAAPGSATNRRIMLT